MTARLLLYFHHRRKYMRLRVFNSVFCNNLLLIYDQSLTYFTLCHDRAQSSRYPQRRTERRRRDSYSDRRLLRRQTRRRRIPDGDSSGGGGFEQPHRSVQHRLSKGARYVIASRPNGGREFAGFNSRESVANWRCFEPLSMAYLGRFGL